MSQSHEDRDQHRQWQLWLMTTATGIIFILLIALLIKNWNTLGYVWLGILGLLAFCTLVCLIYGLIRIWLDIRARTQTLRIEREKHEAAIEAERLRIELEQKRLASDIALRQELQAAEIERERVRIAIERERTTVELALMQGKYQLDSHIALTRVAPDTYIIDREIEQITAFPPFPQVKAAPAEKEKAPDYLVSPAEQPTQAYLLSHLEQNRFVISPGVRASNGEIVYVDLLAVPHLKIIGSTGFGKSCLAAAMLDQLIQTHDPRGCKLALLDLEHKTSRLFEETHHVAQLRIGQRLVQMVATNADEVAEYLGYLKRELDRRTGLTDAELYKQPVIFIYVEEMLSLQYEVIDPQLLDTIFRSLTILSVRGRKYGMFLLSCMQTDYSTEELKVSQKMYRFRGAAGIDTTAARAAGFVNTDLIKHNFQHGRPGQFVIEYPAFSDIVLAPIYDVKKLLAQKFGVSGSFGQVAETETPAGIPAAQTGSNTTAKPLQTGEQTDATTPEAKLAEVQYYRSQSWGKVAIIEKVWRVKPGSSKAYKRAESEYEQILAQVEQEIEA